MNVIESTIGHHDYVIARPHFRGQIRHDFFRGSKCRCIASPRPNALCNSVGRERLLRFEV